VSGPALVIRLEIEGPVAVYVDSLSEGEKQRLEFWLNSRDDLAELAQQAIELARRERAA
jgi:hypothetical protein